MLANPTAPVTMGSGKRAGNAELHKVTEVNDASIAYATAHVSLHNYWGMAQT